MMAPDGEKAGRGGNGPGGLSLVAGRPVRVESRADAFRATNPATGQPIEVWYHPATAVQVNEAANAAWRAFHLGRVKSREERAVLLELAADRIEAADEQILSTCEAETGLTRDRLSGEMGRTTATLRLLAGVVRDGSWRQIMIDPGEPKRRPAPKPDLRRMLVPLGPVAVFGASNFPLAYSTAGTDAASALAAGCPVIVKGHPLHPGTGELVARAVCEAVREAGFPEGWFSFLHAGGGREREIGAELVRHPCVRAGGFTGSFAGGTALARLAAERPDPIPFYAEMGSVNPVFLLPGSVATEPIGIAEHLARAIGAYAGQQCTCPGLIFVVRGQPTETFTDRLRRELEAVPGTPMLAARIRRQYLEGLEQMVDQPGVRVVLGDIAAIRGAAGRVQDGHPTREAPVLLRTKSDSFIRHERLHEETFGPEALIVECDDAEEMLRCAGAIQGSLTASVFLANSDLDLAEAVVNILSMRAGRIVFNGVPTGVEVAHAMVHGGPFPATNRPDTTAVGPVALERWCRPVCFQNAPPALLPAALRDGGDGSSTRLIAGALTSGPGEPGREADGR